MRHVRIACLVEGDGEVEALPVLLRRIVHAIDPSTTVTIPPAFRHPSGSIRKRDGIERAVNAVAIRYPEHSILILIDCDDDCPGQLGSALNERAKQARPDTPVSLVLAHREYETWFLTSADSLAGRRGLSDKMTAPEFLEEIRDAKGWLSRHVHGTGRYSPTQDQAALSHFLDLEHVRARSRSFQKLWKEVEATVRDGHQRS